MRQMVDMGEEEMAYWVKNATDLHHIHYRQLEQENT